MARDAAISVRVEPSLKKRLESEATKSKTTLASFALRTLEVHSRAPTWSLIDPEVVHSVRTGTSIKLSIAEGWPDALINPDHAEHLTAQLLEAVKVSRKMA